MEIVKLPPGTMAPADTDCIKIDAAPDGQFTLVASALTACGEEADSVALVGSAAYSSYAAAEAAGLAWAEAQCVATVYVETGDSPEPTLPRR
jgi:Cys-tRNA synthase (O-phospho-L-seryl-tRNA:Cys-tRNA synthase)